MFQLGLALISFSTKQAPGKSDFTEVTRGTRSQDARVEDTRPNLDLGNRYDGLRS